MVREDNPIVSVIIAVYNTEDYVGETLDSIINQTLDNLEIICINDASTDNSLDILEEYAKKDSRIKIINNDINSGGSISRNKGLDIAKGEFVTFHDSDDTIESDAYEKLYKFAKQYDDQDFVIFDAVRFNDAGTVWKSILHSRSIKGETYTQTNFLEHKELVFDTSAANKFIKKEFIDKHELRFLENTLYEDLLFSMEVLCASDCFGIYPEVKYYWRVRQNKEKSITQQVYSLKNLKDRITISKNIIKLFNSQEKFKDLLEPFYVKLIEIDILQFLNEFDRCDDEFKKIMVDEVLPFLKTIPDCAFNTISDIDKAKYDLFVNECVDGVTALSSEQRSNKLNDRQLKADKRELKKTIREKNKEIKQFKKENRKLTNENDRMAKKNEKLTEKNNNLKEEIKIVKSTKGWFKYKFKNIYMRIFGKI